MAKVIDKLVVQLGLEVSDIKKDVNEVKKAVTSLDNQETKARAKKRKEEKASHKEQISNLKELEKTVLKFYAAFSGGKALSEFVSDTVQSSANLQRLSSSLNSSAGTLQKWSNVLTNVGGNGEEAINTITGLTDAISSLKLEGNLETAKWLSKINVSVVDESGMRKPVDKLLEDIRSGMKQLAPEDQRIIAKHLGIGPDLLYNMNKTDEEWNKLIHDAERQSKVFDELSPKTQKWMEAWRTFSSEMKSGGAQVISNILDTKAAKTAEEVMSGFKSEDYLEFAKKEGLGKSVLKTLAYPFVMASGLPLSILDDKESKTTDGSLSSTIASASKKFGVSESILNSLLKAESNFNPNAVSPKGAKGMAQFMPATAAQYGVDVNSPQSSIHGAANYLGDLLQMFGGDYKKALAGYNWGQGNVMKTIQAYGSDWLSHAPMETQKYVSKVMSIGNITINTQATNAKEIARDIRGELAAPAESGMR